MINKIIDWIDPVVSDELFTKIYEISIIFQIVGLIVAVSLLLSSSHWALALAVMAIVIPNILNMVNVYMIFSPESEE